MLFTFAEFRRFQFSVHSVALTLIITVFGALVFTWSFADIIAANRRVSLLRQHSRHTIEHIDIVLQEAETALHLANNNSFGFCSAGELTLLRRHFMRSLFLKAIGRRRNGLLYCSTGLGVLETPRPVPQVPLISTERFNIHWPFEMAFGNKYPALLIEKAEAGTGIDATILYSSVLPADLFQVIAIAGRTVDMPLPSMGESLLDPSVSECVKDLPICVTTSMTPDTMRSIHSNVILITTAAGAVLGFGIGIAVASYRRRYKSVAARLRRAIKRDELIVAYQPISDISERRTVGGEALVRWPSGNASPDEFIEVAEKEGFIEEITEIVLKIVIRDMVSLFAQRPDFRISINVSAAELIDGRLFRLLDRYWPTTLLRNHVGFELTERSTVGFDALTPAISRLRQAGHCVYIDDFGTGHSNLAQINSVAVDFIKLDRSLLNSTHNECRGNLVLPGIITIARQLGANIVIEGIETEQDLAYVRGLGRGILGQGWLLGRPMSKHEFLAFVATPPN